MVYVWIQRSVGIKQLQEFSKYDHWLRRLSGEVLYFEPPCIRFKRFQSDKTKGRATMTTESSKNGSTTLPRMNFSGYVRHVTMTMSTSLCVCCLAVGLGLGVGFDLASGCLAVIRTYLYYFPLSLYRTPNEKVENHCSTANACNRLMVV